MRSLDAAEVSVVLVTVPSEEVGRQIATAVVGEGLAACVNIVPGVRSIFHWEGRLEDEPELLLLIKARTDRLGPLEARVRALHPYAVPEFIALPVTEGHRPYLDWVGGHATTREVGGLTKNDLINAVAAHGLSKRQSAAVVEAVFETMLKAFEQGSDVKIVGFGHFRVRRKMSRKGRNPQTGNEIEITARKVLTFKPSKGLKAYVNQQS